MARTLQQEKITLVIRQDLMDQAQAEGEASQLNTAELIRRAIDLYLTMFPAPTVYATGELLGEIADIDPDTGNARLSYPLNKKLPFHINSGLLGELDRYAMQTGQSADEVANRSIVLYLASLTERRTAAEALEPEGEELSTEAVADAEAEDDGGVEAEDDGGVELEPDPSDLDMEAAGWPAEDETQPTA